MCSDVLRNTSKFLNCQSEVFNANINLNVFMQVNTSRKTSHHDTLHKWALYIFKKINDD